MMKTMMMTMMMIGKVKEEKLGVGGGPGCTPKIERNYVGIARDCVSDERWQQRTWSDGRNG